MYYLYTNEVYIRTYVLCTYQPTYNNMYTILIFTSVYRYDIIIIIIISPLFPIEYYYTITRRFRKKGVRSRGSNFRLYTQYKQSVHVYKICYIACSILLCPDRNYCLGAEHLVMSVRGKNHNMTRRDHSDLAGRRPRRAEEIKRRIQ